MKLCINHKDRKVFSKGLCAACYKLQYFKPLKRTPLKKKPFFIKPIADKRKKQLRIYDKEEKVYLAENPICHIRGINCQVKATEVHHTGGREGELLLDKNKWKAACRNCHSEATDNSKKAIEDGNSISRHKK